MTGHTAEAAGRKKNDSGFSRLLEASRGPSDEQRIRAAVRDSSVRHGVPEALVLGVIKQESNFNPEARSRVGAVGLMQLMPATAREMGVRDATNVEQNVEGGTRYLRQMLDRFGGDVEKALAAYNAGPSRVERSGGIPEIEETKKYVPAVLAYAEDFSAKPDLEAMLALAVTAPPPPDLPLRFDIDLNLLKSHVPDDPPPPEPAYRRV